MEDGEDEEYVLWIRFKSGDRDAFSQIYSRYVGILYNYGFRIVSDSTLVQDAIQDLFTDLWSMRKNLANTTSIKYYLFRSLRRKIHRLVETENLSESFLDTDDMSILPFTLSAETVRIENETMLEQIQTLQKAMLDLPQRQLEAIRLRFFEGFELHEVAEIMQMNEQSVRNLLHRSIRKLRLSFDLLSVLLLFHQIL
jgi:RNA polymerase sigma factor (sigma-70 family)